MPTPTPYIEEMTRHESSVLSASSALYIAPSPTIFVARGATAATTSCEKWIAV